MAEAKEQEQGRERRNRRARVYTGEIHTADRRRSRGSLDTAGDRDRKDAQSCGPKRSVRGQETARQSMPWQRSQAESARQRRTPGKAEQAEARQRRTPGKAEQAEAWQRRTSGRAEQAEARQRTESVGKHRDFQEKLRKHRISRVRRVLYGIAGLLAVFYIAVAVYYGFHFYDDTVILGMDCGRMTGEEVKQAAAKKLGEYELQIQERGEKTEMIHAKEIGLGFVDDGSIDTLMKQQRPYFWPVMMLLPKKETDSVAFSYDKEAARERINALACMDSVRAIPPRDAYIAAGAYGFEVIQEVEGTTLNKDRTEKLIFACLDSGADSVSLEEEGCYIAPEIYSDNEKLVRDAASMNELASASITLDFGVAQEVVDATLMQEWITETGDGIFAIDDASVEQYVESLAAKYDTFGLPVEFATSLGTTVTLSGGDYGWCLDQDATLAALRKAMDEGYRGTMEPVYLYSGMSHENGGIGYTYVEICISQQRMWCYENGELIVDTPVVTGNPNKGNGTPTGGVWAIDAKKRDAILTGEGYTSPVDYWMPFNGDVGIHDLKERAYFGGTIYLSNGSHGCVNTPYEQVQIIYDTVSIGTPVIVYE